MKTTVKNKRHWHKLRAKHIGSSEAAVLFGVGQYATPYEIYYRKRGDLEEPNLDDNPRVVFGSELEAGIAQGIAKLYDRKIRECPDYYSTEWGAGATPDYEIYDDQTGAWCPLEIKNVDYLVWRDTWLHEDDDHEPPLQIAIQVQHQMICMGASVGYIGALVGGNDPYLIRVERREKLAKLIEQRVKQFWQSIKDGNGPPPTPDDLAAYCEVNAATDHEILNMMGDESVETLIRQYRDAQELIKLNEGIKDEAKLRLAEIAGDAEVILTDAGKATFKTTAAKPEKTVVHKAQPEKRAIRVYPRKGTYQ